MFLSTQLGLKNITILYGTVYIMHRFGRPVMRHMIGERPWEIAKISDGYTVKFYPMIKGQLQEAVRVRPARFPVQG